jgi:hypothetical protein
MIRRKEEGQLSPSTSDGSAPKQKKRIHIGMIKRSSDKPKRVDPMGWISEKANEERARSEEHQPEVIVEGGTPPKAAPAILDHDLAPIVESPKPTSEFDLSPSHSITDYFAPKADDDKRSPRCVDK